MVAAVRRDIRAGRGAGPDGRPAPARRATHPASPAASLEGMTADSRCRAFAADADLSHADLSRVKAAKDPTSPAVDSIVLLRAAPACIARLVSSEYRNSSPRQASVPSCCA